MPIERTGAAYTKGGAARRERVEDGPEIGGYTFVCSVRSATGS